MAPEEESAIPGAPASQAQLRVLVALAAVYVVWGSTYYVLRIALEELPPFLLAGSRFLCAGSILYLLERARGTPPPSASGWWAGARVGFLLLAVANGGVTFAEQTVSSALAAVMVASMPLWAALFARLFGERPSRREWLGLGLGLGGVALLHLDGDLRAHPAGALALGLAPVSWAFGSLWSRRLPLPAGPMATAVQMLGAAAVLLGVAAVRGESVGALPSARVLAAFAYLVVLGSLLAFSAYTYLLRAARPAVATSYAYVNPLVAIALGVGLGREQVGPAALVGAAVILLGVGLVLRRRGGA